MTGSRKEAKYFFLIGIVALIVGIVLAWRGGNLIQVAGSCCAVVFILELFIC